MSDATVEALTLRVESLERRNIGADGEHTAFRTNDLQTAAAVGKLADAINDPRTGLIVELASFRREVQSDRQMFKAWIAGASFAIGLVFSVVTVYAPSIQAALGVKP